MSRNSPARKSAAPLPVPLAEARALPMLSAPAQLCADLTELVRAVEDDDLPALRRAQPVVAGLRKRFAEVDRPADTDAIATAALTITTTMPMSNGIDPQMLSSLLCEDLAEMNFTSFELERAVRELRWASEFFSMPALRKELQRARRLAAHYRRALTIDPDKRVAQIEDEIRRRKKERARMIVAIREAIEELRRDGKLCFPIYRLPGIGYLDPALLMEALNDDERDRQWATSLFADPERERMRDALPDGWQPPDDERVVEILEEEAEGDDAGHVVDDDEAAA